jgi:hypothetical protein
VLVAALAVTIVGIDQCAAERPAQGVHALPVSNAIRRNINVAISTSVARFHSTPRKKAKRIRETTKMKNWDTQKTSRAERLRRRTQIRVGQDCRGRRSIEFSASNDAVWRPRRSPTSIPPRSMTFT